MSPPGQQIRELQQAVERLPSIPAFYARSRLLPRLADAHHAVDQREPVAAIASLRSFLREIGGLRMHVPLNDVLPLVEAARCTMNSLGSPST